MFRDPTISLDPEYYYLWIVKIFLHMLLSLQHCKTWIPGCGLLVRETLPPTEVAMNRNRRDFVFLHWMQRHRSWRHLSARRGNYSSGVAARWRGDLHLQIGELLVFEVGGCSDAEAAAAGGRRRRR